MIGRVLPAQQRDRQLTPDAGDPKHERYRESYKHHVSPTRTGYTMPKAPIECIGIYQKPSQIVPPLNEVRDGDDAPVHGITRGLFGTSQSARPLSQFDAVVFNKQDAEGRIGDLPGVARYDKNLELKARSRK